jgi:hypothetical protein
MNERAAGRREPGHEGLGWVASAILVGTALRLFHLAQHSLWIDEYVSLATVRVPLTEITRSALGDHALNPPLYFWILHLTTRALGEGEAALRLPSVVAGVLTIPVLWLLARVITRSSWVANFSAWLLALNPLHLWYSQEARPYALLLLFIAAALACLAKALQPEGGARGWVAFAVSSALSLLTHVFGVVPLAVGAVWVLLARDRRLLLRFGAAALAGVALVAPVLIMVLDAAAEVEGPGSPPRALTGLEIPYTFFTFLAGYSFGPPVRELQELGAQVAILRHITPVLLVGVLFLVLAWLALRDRTAPVPALAAVTIIPLVGALAACLLTGTNYSVRYAFPGILGFLPLAAVGLARAAPPVRGFGAAALLALFLVSDGQWFLAPQYGKEDSRGAVRCLNQVLDPDATVAVAPAYMARVIREYSSRAGHSLRIVGVAKPQDLTEAAEAAALVLTRLQHVSDPAELRRTFAAGVEPVNLSAGITGYRVYLSGSAASDTPTCTPDLTRAATPWARHARPPAAGR